MIKEQPKEITACYLECVLMPNGEILSLGKTVGWFREYKDYLTPMDKSGKSDERL